MWNIAWIGFDVALAAWSSGTGWLVVQRRQVAMLVSLLRRRFLLCDAWFDVCLSWNTSEQAWALATAALVELPAAVLLATSALDASCNARR